MIPHCISLIISDVEHFHVFTSHMCVFFRKNKITRDKGGQYIMIKGSIQEDTTIVNIYSTNTGVPQYIRQTLTDIKGEINSNKIIGGDFNTPFTPMDR